jgi:hypothetical protein
MGRLGKATWKRSTTLLKRKPELVFSREDDPSNMTPLHLAAIIGHKAAAEFLLTNEADANAKDKNGGTPLRAAMGNPNRFNSRYPDGIAFETIWWW